MRPTPTARQGAFYVVIDYVNATAIVNRYLLDRLYDN